MNEGTAGAQDPGNNGSAIPSSGSKPNFLERLLPTAGGIIGGIATLPLEALDAVSGVGGTALNVAGASAGGALGQKLENALTGDNGSTLASGIENGVGAGVGGVLGSGIAKLAGGVVSPAADTGATKLLQAQFKGTLDNDTAKALAGMGITDARQVGQTAPLITSGNGALSTGVKTALAGSADSGNGIDITGLDDIARNALAEHGAQPNTIDTVGNNLTSSINNMVNPEDITKAVNKQGLPTYSYSQGSLQNALPENVFSQSQKMDQLASQAFNKAYDKMGNVTNVEELSKGQTYSKLGDELQSRAFGTNGSNPLPLTQEAKDSIIQQLQPVKDINPAVYNHYVSGVSNANTVQDLRPLQAPMVRGSQALNATGNIAATKGLSMSDIARGTIGAAMSPASKVAQLAVASPLADRTGASLLGKIGGVTDKNSALVSKILPLTAKIATITGANLPNDVASSQSNSAIPSQGVNSMQPQNGTAQNPLAQLYNAILSQSQTPTGISGNLISTANTLAPLVQKQQLAAPVISNLLSAYQNAGGAQGLGGGLLSHLTGLIGGTPANTFNNQANAASAQLSGILGISPTQAQSMIPQLMQTSQTAAPQVGGLQSILGNIGGSSPSAIPAQ